ncbi:EF-hand domain-containing protein [Planctomicrobium piriforme]|uniref:EF-hand domain-containing protein n=1 Tax=Planctomicrobium piriforme TaxID=1576369 RepID=UPI001113BDA1|nr:EF-hand domain-containing protein [Planctomicrobium piriforme]
MRKVHYFAMLALALSGMAGIASAQSEENPSPEQPVAVDKPAEPSDGPAKKQKPEKKSDEDQKKPQLPSRDDMFKRLDKDGDGAISRQEFDSAADRMEAMHKEFQQRMERGPRGGRPSLAGRDGAPGQRMGRQHGHSHAGMGRGPQGRHHGGQGPQASGRHGGPGFQHRGHGPHHAFHGGHSGRGHHGMHAHHGHRHHAFHGHESHRGPWGDRGASFSPRHHGQFRGQFQGHSLARHDFGGERGRPEFGYGTGEGRRHAFGPGPGRGGQDWGRPQHPMAMHDRGESRDSGRRDGERRDGERGMEQRGPQFHGEHGEHSHREPGMSGDRPERGGPQARHAEGFRPHRPEAGPGERGPRPEGSDRGFGPRPPRGPEQMDRPQRDGEREFRPERGPGAPPRGDQAGPRDGDRPQSRPSFNREGRDGDRPRPPAPREGRSEDRPQEVDVRDRSADVTPEVESNVAARPVTVPMPETIEADAAT